MTLKPCRMAFTEKIYKHNCIATDGSPYPYQFYHVTDELRAQQHCINTLI